MLPEQKLDALLTRHAEVAGRTREPAQFRYLCEAVARILRARAVVESIKAYRAASRELAELDALVDDPATDPEMRGLAESEKGALQERRDQLAQQVRLALIPKDAMDERNVILEIRAGTGGDEASLFAGDLFRMYERYAAKQGWKVEMVSASEGTMGGYKEIIAEISGRGAFAKLKFESGVHRVQRVPDTETPGRIHTSAATVAVLPEAEEVDIEINDADLKIDTMRVGGAGGQHVNKTESAIRITHLPSGIVVDDAGGALAAQATAPRRWRCCAPSSTTWSAASSIPARAAERKRPGRLGDRSERIRTYNFPQGRVTDHRINLTLYKLPQIMEGEALGEIIDALVHRASGRAAGGGGQGIVTMLPGLAPGMSIAAARRVVAQAFRHGRPGFARARRAHAGRPCARRSITAALAVQRRTPASHARSVRASATLAGAPAGA